MEEAPIRTPNKLYNFGPDKRLQIVTNEGFQAVDAIRTIDNEYATKPAEHFRAISEAMRPSITPNSPPYAVFEDEDSSRDTALIIALPFASSIRPDISPSLTAGALHYKEPKIDSNEWHNGEKHYTLFRVMKALGIRDTEGHTIPVIAIASPSKDWHPHFRKEQRASLREGDFAPFAGYIQEILDHEGIGQVHIGGYSMGAAIGHSAMHNLVNADVLSATLGEPTNYKKRSRGEMFSNYILNRPTPPNNSSIESKEKWTISGPQSRTDLEAFPNHWQKNILLQGLGNAWLLSGALTQPTLFDDLELSMQKGRPSGRVIPLTLEYGSTSAVTHDIEDYLRLDNFVLSKYETARKLRIVKTVGHEAVGAPHLHGESPLFYSLWVAESLLWAMQANKNLG